MNYEFSDLVALMARLRGPDGCPWDRKQTPESLKPFLVEECYEVIDALDEGDPAKVKEELGDLLFQIIFHARIAEERGHFTIHDVIAANVEKMTRRHPHVFGDASRPEHRQHGQRWVGHHHCRRDDCCHGKSLPHEHHLLCVSKARHDPSESSF